MIEELKIVIEEKNTELMNKLDAIHQEYVELECNSVEFENVYKEFQYRLSTMSDNYFSDIIDEANFVLEKSQEIQYSRMPNQLSDYEEELYFMRA